MLTLVGPGRIGRTRLAIATAKSHHDAFVDGLAFASLAAIRETALIPDVVARSLRLTLSESPAKQLLAYLHLRSMLLILDNCEQLDGDLTWLSELLAHAPPEQNAMMRLSVFRGGWQAEEASSVAGADLPLLRQLVDKSLVRVG